ncbi:MAG: hypothetical protein ACKVP0_08005 [Pirellulaceae bacterium]
MTNSEWYSCNDPEPMVRALPVNRYQRELRLFAVTCARRVWSLLPVTCQVALNLSEEFANEKASEAQLRIAVNTASEELTKIWVGSRSPDARIFAASAAIDASSVWPRTTANVMAAISCAASAAACAQAEAADDLNYDAVFATTQRSELAVQASLLREMIAYPFE